MATPRLDRAYATRVQSIRARVESYAQARFAAGQYRDADLERFVSQVVPVALAGRKQVSALTDSYLSQVLSSTGKRVKPLGPIDTDLLRGVAADEVYARPYVTVRTKLANGLPLDAAVSAGTARLTDIVLADMQLAKTHTARNVFSRSPGISGYMRTLTGDKNCALCTLASTQFYHKADLLPIHPGCDCGVTPVRSGDRSRAETERIVSETHEAVEDRLGVSDSGGRGPDYRKQLIVREHGELGPVLAVKGQHFAGPAAVN
jgi:hypothetical protein